MFAVSKEIFCTIGPASLNEWTLKRMGNTKVSLLRINLSHTNFKDLENIITKIKSYSDIPICLDTEGAQIRTGLIKEEEAYLNENDTLQVASTFYRIARLKFHPRESFVLQR